MTNCDKIVTEMVIREIKQAPSYSDSVGGERRASAARLTQEDSRSG
jgi:hypothetical protein